MVACIPSLMGHAVVYDTMYVFLLSGAAVKCSSQDDKMRMPVDQCFWSVDDLC